MKVSNLIFTFLVVLLFHSCYVVHQQTIKKFKNCYSNTNTGIETIIIINGYYGIDYIFEDEQSGKKCIRTDAMLFSDDGIYIGASDLDFFLNAAKNDLWESKGFDMGIYNIHNDTIWIEYVFIGSATLGCNTVIYEILDSNTLKRIYYGNCENPTKPFLSDYKTSDAKFVPFDSLPNVDNMWIKKMVLV